MAPAPPGVSCPLPPAVAGSQAGPGHGSGPPCCQSSLPGAGPQLCAPFLTLHPEKGCLHPPHGQAVRTDRVAWSPARECSRGPEEAPEAEHQPAAQCRVLGAEGRGWVLRGDAGSWGQRLGAESRGWCQGQRLGAGGRGWVPGAEAGAGGRAGSGAGRAVGPLYPQLDACFSSDHRPGQRPLIGPPGPSQRRH